MSNLATSCCCAALILGGGAMLDQSDAFLLPTTTKTTTRKISYQHADSQRRRKSSVLRYDFSNNVDEPTVEMLPKSAMSAMGFYKYSDDKGSSLDSASTSSSVSSSNSSLESITEDRIAAPPQEEEEEDLTVTTMTTADEERPTTIPPKENDNDDNTTMIKSAQEIINNYTPGTFNPHPLFSNSHVQTIVGGLFRTSAMYWDNDTDNLFTVLSRIATNKKSDTNNNPDDTFVTFDERERIITPDNDFFDVTWKYSPVGIPRRGTVVLTHGLESSSDAPLSKDLATAYHLQGFDVAYINFRGCSGQPNLTPGSYHLSFTNDLQYFLTCKKTKLKNNGPVFLSGFSLGANVVVNFLAQAGNSITETYNVHGAAVNCCPMDVTRITDNLNDPENFFSFNVYGRDLKKRLVDKLMGQALNPGIDLPFCVEDVERCETIRDVENLLSLIYGFEDAYDYYERSSVADKLDKVAVPLYVVSSDDDPFFEGDARPSTSFAKTTKFLYTERGGHCGNILHTGDAPDVRVGDDGRLLQSSWMPDELARFVDHVASEISPTESGLGNFGV